MLQTHVESKDGLQSFIEASPEEELSPLGIASIQDKMKKLADYGRNGDIYVVHAAEGETVIPLEVLNANPKVRDLLFTQMTEMGLDPERYVVGNELNSLNPVTGAPEFFFSRIFKSVKKRVKKLRGTGVFTTLLPLAGQFIGVPGGPQFLRPGTAGSNMVYSMLGQYLEQGRDFDPKKAAKGIALNLAKGLAFKGGMNVLRGRPTLEGIDSSYFTGEGRKSTAELFGFGDKAETIGAREPENIGALEAQAALREGIGIGIDDDVAADQRVIDTRPIYFGKRESVNAPFSKEAVDRHRERVSESPHRPTTGARTSVVSTDVPASQDTLLKRYVDEMAVHNIDPNSALGLAEYERMQKREAAANKTGLFGYKGPLGLPNIGGHITKNEGLANLIDLGLYGTAGYFGLKEAGAFEEEDEPPPERGDLAGFVPQKTGVDLLRENPDRYRLPAEALNPYLFASAAKGGMVQKMATGGFPRRQLLVEGPGTGTSDEIPAMLSDGEFVMTNRAVEGADPSGNGDRYAGAKNLYGIMRNFEMRA